MLTQFKAGLLIQVLHQIHLALMRVILLRLAAAAGHRGARLAMKDQALVLAVF